MLYDIIQSARARARSPEAARTTGQAGIVMYRLIDDVITI